VFVEARYCIKAEHLDSVMKKGAKHAIPLQVKLKLMQDWLTDLREPDVPDNGDVTTAAKTSSVIVTSPLASRVPPVPAAGPSPVAVEAAPVQAMFTVMERVVLLTERLLRQPWHLLLTVRVRLTVLS